MMTMITLIMTLLTMGTIIYHHAHQVQHEIGNIVLRRGMKVVKYKVAEAEAEETHDHSIQVIMIQVYSNQIFHH